MKQLQLYIGKTIIGATLIVALLVAGLVVLLTLVGELGDVGHGGYTLMDAMYYVVLTAPLMFYQLFPLVGLVGALLALGLLSSRSELTVMRAAGYSLGQICLAVLNAALLLVILVTVIGETVCPDGLQYANSYKTKLMSTDKATHTTTGVWVKDHDNIIHIAKVLPHRSLEGITRYKFDKNKKLVSESYSKWAVFRDNKWILLGVTRTVFGEDAVKTDHQQASLANFSIYPNLFGITQLQPAEMSLIRLYTYVQYQVRHGQPVVSYRYSFWQRVLQPLSTAVMMFLAIPFVFGSLRSVSMGLRTLLGIIMGGSFYLLNKFLGPVSLVYQVPPFLAAVIPTLLFIGLGIYLMRRVR